MSTPSSMLPPVEETTQILVRYNVAQAHNVVYTYDELRELGIQPEFLLAVLGVFEDPEAFRPAEFEHFPLTVIVDYLQKTHHYYVTKKLLEIEQSIHLLIDAYPRAHPLLVLLRGFYADYKAHLQKHIEVEERELLPYILKMSHAGKLGEWSGSSAAISIAEFMHQHHDTEKDLAEVRAAILHYSPPEGNQTLYRILLSQLQVLEKDLAIHAMMEDEVLLPRALELEKELSAKSG